MTRKARNDLTEQLLREQSQTMSVKQMAKTNGCSEPTIRARLHKYGIPTLSSVLKQRRHDELMSNPKPSNPVRRRKTYKNMPSESRLRSFVDNGESDKEIAETLGVPIYVVARLRSKYGIHRRRQKVNEDDIERLHDDGLGNEEIAEQLGCSASTVGIYVAIIKTRRDASSTSVKYVIDKDDLQHMVDDGMEDREIAKVYGCTKTTIWKRRRMLGIKKTPRK